MYKYLILGLLAAMNVLEVQQVAYPLRAYASSELLSTQSGMRMQRRCIFWISASILGCASRCALPLQARHSLITGTPACALVVQMCMRVDCSLLSERYQTSYLLSISKRLFLPRHPSEDNSIRHRTESASAAPGRASFDRLSKQTICPIQPYRNIHCRSLIVTCAQTQSLSVLLSTESMGGECPGSPFKVF